MNTFTESARPGQTVVLYRTGLGPVDFDETNLSKPQDLNVNVEVLVGAREAYVLYKGRSSCCSGGDQIDFIVPESVEGCYVPVVVTVDGAISDFATISVEPDGKPCSSPSGISAADLERLQSAGSFRAGSISLSCVSTRINGPTPAASANEETEAGSAGFLQYDASQVLPYFQTEALGSQSLYGLSPGACTVFPFRFDGNGQTSAGPIQPPAPLDAGPAINVKGPRGSRQLAKLHGGYWAAFGAVGAPDYLEAGTYTFDNGEGSADIGAFRTTVEVAEPLVWNETETIRSAERAQGLTVTWRGGDPSGIVSIVGTSANGPAGASYTCSERVSAGRFAVPPIVLMSVPSTDTGALSISVATDFQTS